MIAIELINQIVTNIKSTYSSMTGIDNLYVASVIDSARESVLNKRSAAGDKTVPSQLMQYFNLYYDSTIQPLNNIPKLTVYSVPRLAQISAGITAPINVNKTSGVAYPLYTSVELYETLSRRPEIKQTDSVVLVNTSAGNMLYLYGQRVNKLRCQGVLASPLKLETFNVFNDEYPVTGTLYSAIEAEIVSLYMRNLQAQAPRFIKESGVK